MPSGEALATGVPPLPPRRDFAWRALAFAAFGLGGVGLALLAGVLGYRVIGGLPWIDAFLNAAMILSGMGPVDAMPDDAAKVFAGLYALVGSVAWSALIAVTLYPFIHRMLHALHLQMQADEDDDP